MRKTFLLSVLLLILASGFAWAQFWKGYGDTERRAVAEAYWLAGSQYQVVGKTAKGDEYKALAKIMDPSLDPASIKDAELPSAADLLAQGRATNLTVGSTPVPITVPEPAAAPAAAIDSSAAIMDTFKEWMGAILSKDAEGALKDLSANVRFLRLRQTVTKHELETTLLGYFDKAEFPSVTVSDAVDMTSIFVDPADSPVDGVSGPVYVLNGKAMANLSDSIPFWADYMEFYFRQENGSWSIFAIK